MKDKILSSLSKYLITLFNMTINKVKVVIHWLPKDHQELGFTCRKKNVADVYLNRGTHPIFKDLTPSQTTMAVTGVAIHEFMHQILTNFSLFGAMLDKTPNEKKQLFKTLFNIFEDSRIESFAPSYFAGSALTALEYAIQSIWDASTDIDPSKPVFNQVLSGLIQWGDTGLYKGTLSEEAYEVFNKILPLFNAAIDSVSCTNCIMKAKEAVEILFPYMPEDYMDDYSGSGESDATGEDADASGIGSGSLLSKAKARRARSVADGSKSEDTPTKDSGAESKKESKEDDDGSDTKITPEEGGDGIGAGLESSPVDTDEVEEVYEDDGATEEEIENAAAALEEELARIAASEEAEAAGEKSDYDFASTEKPSGDKWVRTISHHKAESVPDLYAPYKEKTASESHELAKLIQRRFRTRPGGRKRSDHGDLNLMRYKDPNFRSPLIFDKKEKNHKHSVAVLLLVDESGSMSGSRISSARLATTMLAEAMAACNIPCCIVGHSGDSRYNESVELEHYTTFKNTPADRASIPMISARCQNRDGPAIRWASSILRKRPERKKLMIVISDGQPCADRYYGDEAIFDTKSAIRDAKRAHDVVGVVLEAGYATEVLHTMYGDDFVECESAPELKDKIAKLITQKCKEW